MKIDFKDSIIITSKMVLVIKSHVHTQEPVFENKLQWTARFPGHTINNFDFNSLLDEMRLVKEQFYNFD